MATFEFLGFVAAAGFLVLAARWLFELRRTAIAAKVPLTALDKLIAALPVVYTVLCLFTAAAVGDRLREVFAAGGARAWLPVLGEVDSSTAIWVGALIVGLALATPALVVFAVEAFFAGRFPELVDLGRRAVWSTLTGVRAARPSRTRRVHEDEDARWKKLLH